MKCLIYQHLTGTLSNEGPNGHWKEGFFPGAPKVGRLHTYFTLRYFTHIIFEKYLLYIHFIECDTLNMFPFCLKAQNLTNFAISSKFDTH